MTGPDLEAYRDEDGSYVVRAPARRREPIDWLAVAWVTVGVVGVLGTIAGAVRAVVEWVK